jgi:hypothetical protein
MDWKKGTPLSDGQTTRPVTYIGFLDELRPGAQLPFVDRRWCLELWGDNKTTQRFKTWGHRDGDKLAAHFICTRAGIKMHTDVGFARYSVHIELYNGGWWTHGIDDQTDGLPPFDPGLITLLDTHSPHTVTKDPRRHLESPSKVAAAIDFMDEPPSIADAIDQLVDWLPALALPD